MASGTLRRRRGCPKRKNQGTNRALRCLGKLAIALLLQCWIALLVLEPFVAGAGATIVPLRFALSVALQSVLRCAAWLQRGSNIMYISERRCNGCACKFSAAMPGLHVFTACALPWADVGLLWVVVVVWRHPLFDKRGHASVDVDKELCNEMVELDHF